MASTMLPVQAMGLFGFRKPTLPLRRLQRVAFSRVPRVRHSARAQRAPEQRETQQDKGQVPEWVTLAVKDYDETVKEAQQACLDQQREVDNINKQIEELELMGAPGWALGVMRWLRDRLIKAVTMLEERTREMQTGREKFIQTLMDLSSNLEAKEAKLAGLEAKLAGLEEKLAGLEETPSETPSMTATMWAEMSEEQKKMVEKPATLALALAFQCLFNASVVTGVGWLCGVQVGRLLNWPDDWLSACSSCAIWTAPYVAATLATGSLMPTLSSKRLLRSTAAGPKFYASLPLSACVPLAFVAGGAQVLAYQGVLLQAALGFFSGSGPVGDPALVEENLRGSLGSLVATSGVALLAAPLAVLSVGLWEAGWFAGQIKADELAPALEEELQGAKTAPIDVKQSIYKRYIDETPVQDSELLLLAGRVFGSSAYLAAETLLTGSVWLAMGTSAAGLLASIVLARQQGQQATSLDS